MEDEGWMDMAIEAGQLREAMVTRATIEQAKGVIMGLRRCSTDQAFNELKSVSQRENIKIRELAAALVRFVDPSQPPLEDDDWRLATIVAQAWSGSPVARSAGVGDARMR
ncbi:MAG TPA: ANTAR domain-containing protein [Actinomycetales bacterium]|jgi:hypothetical protein